MAQATVITIPEMLGQLSTLLPSTVRIIGSRDNRGDINSRISDTILLAIEGDALDEGATYTVFIADDGLERCVSLARTA